MNFEKLYHEYSGIAAFNAKGSPEKHMILTWSYLCESNRVTVDHYREFLDKLKVDTFDSQIGLLEIIRELGLEVYKSENLSPAELREVLYRRALVRKPKFVLEVEIHLGLKCQLSRLQKVNHYWYIMSPTGVPLIEISGTEDEVIGSTATTNMYSLQGIDQKERARRYSGE